MSLGKGMVGLCSSGLGGQRWFLGQPGRISWPLLSHVPLERHFGPGDAMAWAYTIFEYIKLFHTNEVMSQFYAVLMGKVSLGLALYPLSPA